jgi:hypothetical protein
MMIVKDWNTEANSDESINLIIQTLLALCREKHD